MKTQYKHIEFEKIEQKQKTSVWECRNHHDDTRIGEVKWHGPWRQYCFFTMNDYLFAKSCLDDISAFIQQLMDDRKVKWVKCEGYYPTDAEEHRSRVLTGSLGLEGPWSAWLIGMPDKVLQNREYEYRKAK